jgi:hypothetical protein
MKRSVMLTIEQLSHIPILRAGTQPRLAARVRPLARQMFGSVVGLGFNQRVLRFTAGRGMHGPCAATHNDQEDQRTKHGEIGASIAHREPKALTCAEQLRDFRGGDSRGDHDQQRDGSGARPEADQDKQTTDDFECADEMSGEVRVWEPNARETKHAHVRVGEFQDALREEDQADGETNQENACRAAARGKEETV